MKFTQKNIVQIITEINLILDGNKSPYNLVADFRYDSISISSIELKNKSNTNELLEYSTRDEAYRWLEGFVTSLINQ